MIVARKKEEEREKERERESRETQKGRREKETSGCMVCMVWYRNVYFSKGHYAQGRYLLDIEELPRHVIPFLF